MYFIQVKTGQKLSISLSDLVFRLSRKNPTNTEAFPAASDLLGLIFHFPCARDLKQTFTQVFSRGQQKLQLL